MRKPVVCFIVTEGRQGRIVILANSITLYKNRINKINE